MSKPEIKRINPKTLFPSLPFGFSQVVTSRGGKIVHVSGQTAWDTEMKIVGAGDLAAQTRKALENVRLALEAAGATPADVVHTRLYIVNYNAKMVETLSEILRGFFPAEAPPASTWLGVAALAVPEFLIEIEVTAVVD